MSSPKYLPEIRCSCHKLLARGLVVELQIKCPRCGTINHVRAASPDPERQRAANPGENTV